MLRNRTKKESLPEVKPKDMWILLLSTVRYSLGRKTYMVSYTHDLIKKYKNYMDKEQKKQVYNEIRDELNEHHHRIAAGRKGTLGDQCDVDEWNELSLELLDLINKR